MEDGVHKIAITLADKFVRIEVTLGNSSTAIDLPPDLARAVAECVVDTADKAEGGHGRVTH